MPQEEGPSAQDEDVEMKDIDIPESSTSAAPIDEELASAAPAIVKETTEATEETKVTAVAAITETAAASPAADTKDVPEVQQKTAEVHVEQEMSTVPMVVDDVTAPQPKVSAAAPAVVEPAFSKPPVEEAQSMDVDSPAVTEPPQVVTEPEVKPNITEVETVPEARKPAVDTKKPAVEEKREPKVVEKPPQPLPAAPAPAPPTRPRARDLSIPEKPRVAPPAQKIAPLSWSRFASNAPATTSHRRPRDEEKEEGELSEESGDTPPRGR